MCNRNVQGSNLGQTAVIPPKTQSSSVQTVVQNLKTHHESFPSSSLQINSFYNNLTSWYTSVTTAITGEELDDRRIAVRFQAGPIDFLFSEKCVRPTQPPIQCYRGPLVGTAAGA